VTLGGPEATVSGNVVTLGPSGLVVMMPAGGVTTIPIAPLQTSAVATASSSSSSRALGAIIASSKFAFSVSGSCEGLLILCDRRRSRLA
jgi:hypothetical protein